MSSSNGLRTVALAITLSTVAWLSGCGSGASADKKAGTGGPGQSNAGSAGKRLYPVRVQTVASSPVTYELQAIGSIEAKDVYTVTARVAGTIYDVKFNEGDTVTTDQVFCTIAPEAYRFTMLKAKAVYDQAVAAVADYKRKNTNAIARAKIDLERTNQEINRRKGVREAGAISDEEIQLYEAQRDIAAVALKDMTEASVTELKTLEASVAEKEAAWKIAEDDVVKSTVRPPINGVIEKRYVTNQLFATTGMPLATIVDRSMLKLKFKVAERDAGAIRDGIKATFSVPAFPNRTFEAEIYHIEEQMDRDARMLTIWAKVTKEPELLHPGYFASVNIITGANKDAIVVPATAVQPTEKGFVAYVIKDGKAERRILKTGLSVTSDQMEILSGLNVGESLVVEGSNALLEGVGVKVLEGAPPSGKPAKEPTTATGVDTKESKDVAGAEKPAK